MCGGLYIETAALKIPGVWLTDSGWVKALYVVQADIASSAVADSFSLATPVAHIEEPIKSQLLHYIF